MVVGSGGVDCDCGGDCDCDGVGFGGGDPPCHDHFLVLSWSFPATPYMGFVLSRAATPLRVQPAPFHYPSSVTHNTEWSVIWSFVSPFLL